MKYQLDIEYIKALRKEHHLSQAKVAKVLGYNQTAYGHRELRIDKFQIKDLIKLAEFYQIPINKFFKKV